MRVLKIQNFSPLAAGTQGFDILTVGAAGAIIDIQRENFTSFQILERRVDTVFGAQLLLMLRGTATDQAGPLFGIPIGGDQLQFITVGAGPTQVRVMLVDEPVKFGSIPLRDGTDAIAAAGNDSPFTLYPPSRLFRQFWFAFSNNFSGHAEVRAQMASINIGTISTSASTGAAGGGITMGPFPQLNQLNVRLTNDDGANVNTFNFALTGDL